MVSLIIIQFAGVPPSSLPVSGGPCVSREGSGGDSLGVLCPLELDQSDHPLPGG